MDRIGQQNEAMNMSSSLIFALVLATCGAAVAAGTGTGTGTGAGAGASAAEPAASQRFPDVVASRVRASADARRHDFDVTISSPYDTPARYADAFRVMSPDGTILGERKLLHDHADEQPFTRDLHGIEIPAGTRRVIVQARDKLNGYGGRTVDVLIPGH